VPQCENAIKLQTSEQVAWYIATITNWVLPLECVKITRVAMPNQSLVMPSMTNAKKQREH